MHKASASRPSAFTWPEERYAAGEGLAKAARAARTALLAIPTLFRAGPVERIIQQLDIALAEYERTRDHP